MNHSSDSRSTVIPALRYRDARKAIEWLQNAFGFSVQAIHDSPMRRSFLTRRGQPAPRYFKSSKRCSTRAWPLAARISKVISGPSASMTPGHRGLA